MSAGRYSFTIEQGATFRRVFTWFLDDEMTTEQDLVADGWSAALQVRDIAGAVIAELSSDGDGITLGAPTPGAIDCRMEAAETELLTPSRLTHRYDLLMQSGSTVVRLVEGTVSISPRVTDT